MKKNETSKQDATDETIRRDGGTATPTGDANEKNETNKQDETIERDGGTRRPTRRTRTTGKQ